MTDLKFHVFASVFAYENTVCHSILKSLTLMLQPFFNVHMHQH